MLRSNMMPSSRLYPPAWRASFPSLPARSHPQYSRASNTRSSEAWQAGVRGLFSDYATLKFGVVVVAATLAWAFLKTGWELGTFHYKRLCTFVGALRKFCRDYWSKTAAV
jgi:hypothetical protein